MKQKIYVRDGRRFVEVVDPLLRVGCYVDNMGRFLDHRTVHSIGRCIGIKDGYYIIAFFDEDVRCIHSDRKFALYKAISQRFVSNNSELYKNKYIPEIQELFLAACEYPELFNEKKDYLSNTSFCSQYSDSSFVRFLSFDPVHHWSIYSTSFNDYLTLKPFSKIKVYGEED